MVGFGVGTMVNVGESVGKYVAVGFALCEGALVGSRVGRPGTAEAGHATTRSSSARARILEHRSTQIKLCVARLILILN